jgi:hypothetical protein
MILTDNDIQEVINTPYPDRNILIANFASQRTIKREHLILIVNKLYSQIYPELVAICDFVVIKNCVSFESEGEWNNHKIVKDRFGHSRVNISSKQLEYKLKQINVKW